MGQQESNSGPHGHIEALMLYYVLKAKFKGSYMNLFLPNKYLIVYCIFLCSLPSPPRHSFLLVNTVIILHLSGLMMVGRMLKHNELVTSTVGEIFFLFKHSRLLTLFESNSLTCSKILVWLIIILKPTINGVMRGIYSEQLSVRVCFLEYPRLW